MKICNSGFLNVKRVYIFNNFFVRYHKGTWERASGRCFLLLFFLLLLETSIILQFIGLQTAWFKTPVLKFRGKRLTTLSALL